jgi:hypothetical protein
MVKSLAEKKLSKDEFKAFLKTLLDQDYPKTKYTNPDAWQKRNWKTT